MDTTSTLITALQAQLTRLLTGHAPLPPSSISTMPHMQGPSTLPSSAIPAGQSARSLPQGSVAFSSHAPHPPRSSSNTHMQPPSTQAPGKFFGGQPPDRQSSPQGSMGYLTQPSRQSALDSAPGRHAASMQTGAPISIQIGSRGSAAARTQNMSESATHGADQQNHVHPSPGSNVSSAAGDMLLHPALAGAGHAGSAVQAQPFLAMSARMPAAAAAGSQGTLPYMWASANTGRAAQTNGQPGHSASRSAVSGDDHPAASGFQPMQQPLLTSSGSTSLSNFAYPNPSAFPPQDRAGLTNPQGTSLTAVPWQIQQQQQQQPSYSKYQPMSLSGTLAVAEMSGMPPLNSSASISGQPRVAPGLTKYPVHTSSHGSFQGSRSPHPHMPAGSFSLAPSAGFAHHPSTSIPQGISVSMHLHTGDSPGTRIHASNARGNPASGASTMQASTSAFVAPFLHPGAASTSDMPMNARLRSNLQAQHDQQQAPGLARPADASTGGRTAPSQPFHQSYCVPHASRLDSRSLGQQPQGLSITPALPSEPSRSQSMQAVSVELPNAWGDQGALSAQEGRPSTLLPQPASTHSR